MPTDIWCVSLALLNGKRDPLAVIAGNDMNNKIDKYIIRIHSKLKILLCLAAAMAFVCQPAHGAFTNDLTIGNAKALALGHAVTADPPGIDSIHFNPAGLVRLNGRQAHIKVLGGNFAMEAEFGEYSDFQKGVLDMASSGYRDELGDLTQEGRDFIYDEAYQSKSKTEGASVMLPGAGMTDVPVTIGAMGGASYNPPGSRFTFATNVYSPMMSGFHRADDDPGRFFQQRSAFTILTYFSPSFGYQMSDELAVGMSVNFNYVGMGMEAPTREPHYGIAFIGSAFFQDNACREPDVPFTDDFDLCTILPPYTTYSTLTFEADQPLALGFNLGLLWRPIPWLTVGLAYNSKIDARMTGDYNWPINPIFSDYLIRFFSGSGGALAGGAAGLFGETLPSPDEIANQGSGKIEASFQFPQRLNAGISIQLTNNWKYNLDVKWTEWSSFSNIKLQFDGRVPLLEVASVADLIGTNRKNGFSSDTINYNIGLQDVTYWSMGTEYQWNPRLSFSAGIEHRPSAVPKERPNAFIPMSEGYLYSLGLSYVLPGDNQLDFALGYFSTKKFYPACSAQMGNGCNPMNFVFSPYQGQDITTRLTAILFEMSYRRHF